jgi:hypothetical protein
MGHHRKQRATLLDPNAPQLRGTHRGAVATLPEPEEAWLAVLGQALPFRATAAIVTLDDTDLSTGPLRRADPHFGNVFRAPLRTQASPAAGADRGDATHRRARRMFNEDGVGDDAPPQEEAAAEEAGALVPPSLADGPSGGEGGAEALIPPDVRQRMDAEAAAAAADGAHGERAVCAFLQQTPFSRIGAQALDVVCFPPHTFRHVVQWAPHVVTDAARVLRPHGVLAVMAQRRARLVGPAEVVADYEAFAEELHAGSSMPEREAEEDGFAGVAFPAGSSVKRRWFTSEFPVATLENLAAYVRSWPEYHAAVSPIADPAEEGVQRRRPLPSGGVADPLEVLLEAIEAFFRHRTGRRYPRDALALEVDTCVITCDSRPSSRRASGGTATLGGVGQRNLPYTSR